MLFELQNGQVTCIPNTMPCHFMSSHVRSINAWCQVHTLYMLHIIQVSLCYVDYVIWCHVPCACTKYKIMYMPINFMLRWLTNVSKIFLLFVFDESLLPLFFSQCNRDAQSLQIIMIAIVTCSVQIIILTCSPRFKLFVHATAVSCMCKLKKSASIDPSNKKS